MKTSKVKAEPVGEDLAAPVRLTPEQLESVAAGFMALKAAATEHSPGTGTATTGLYPTPTGPLASLSGLKTQ